MTSNVWPSISLGEVASPISRPVEVLPGQTYRTIGVKWWGEGAYERVTIDGSQTAAKTLSTVRQNDLIINKIWVRHGSTAVASAEVDGCAGSGEFPTFELNQAQILPRWMHWLTKTRAFWSKCDRLSQGTSGKNRIKPELFLTITIPLPPLDEQRRIVARIEELAAKIEEARGLRREVQQATAALLHSELRRILALRQNDSAWRMQPISTVAAINPSRRDQATRPPPEIVSFVPMSAVDEVSGCIQRPETKRFVEVSKGYTSFQDGDVIFARITPCMQNGKAALASGLVNGVAFGSTEFHVLRPGPQVTGQWLHCLVRHKDFRDDAARHFKGTAGQQRVPQSFLEQKIIAVPPLEEQWRIVAYLDDLHARVDALKRLQAETAAELDALLPSILDRAFKGELV